MAPPRRSSAGFLAVVVGIICHTASGAALNANASLRASLGVLREAYTTNAICSKNRCVNPIFPGMEDLHKLDQSQWLCASLQQTQGHMGFCRAAITYDPALMIPPNGGGQALAVAKLVQKQDNAATTAFYYHLTGLGLEAWDYPKPELADDCIKAIWRMVCFTYFPRAPIGCQLGMPGAYIRPCRSSCMNYIRTCEVECCDESVQCVFEHKKTLPGNKQLTTQGYIPHDGPSSLCTGATRRGAEPYGLIFWVVIAIGLLMTLQTEASSSDQSADGLDPTAFHHVGNWRGQPDYLIKHQFVRSGSSPKDAVLNSCSVPNLAATQQCSGHGSCRMWDPSNIDSSSLTFCRCDDDWADPECRTRRKSQAWAYFLAMFFGFLGADQFYLGFIAKGIVKLFSFGGFGVLWIMDIVAIGSSPVMTANYRTSNDLPHYMFVLSSTMFAMVIGFAVAGYVALKYREERRNESMLLQREEEERVWKANSVIHNNGLKAMMGGPPMPMPPGPYGTMGPVPTMGGMPPTSGMMPRVPF